MNPDDPPPSPASAEERRISTLEHVLLFSAVAGLGIVHGMAHEESLHASIAARLFTLPVLYAASRGGWRAGAGYGVGAACVHALAMAVHAGGQAAHHSVPFLTEHLIQAALLPVAGGFVGALVDRERRQRDERDRVRRVFGRYAAPEVVEHLLASDTPPGPERRELTVLFADLRGFTSASEQLPATVIVELLDDFYETATDALLAHRGVVDKFAGDQAMALFGFPVADGQEPIRALAAAQELALRFGARRREWEQRVGPVAGNLGLGIGISTGEVVVGTVGSQKRADFTAVGDAVNVAARLCAAAQDGQTWVSEGWRERAPVPPELAAVLSGPGVALQVKGKARPVLAWVFEVSERYSPLSLKSSERTP